MAGLLSRTNTAVKLEWRETTKRPHHMSKRKSLTVTVLVMNRTCSEKTKQSDVIFLVHLEQLNYKYILNEPTVSI